MISMFQGKTVGVNEYVSLWLYFCLCMKHDRKYKQRTIHRGVCEHPYYKHYLRGIHKHSGTSGYNDSKSPSICVEHVCRIQVNILSLQAQITIISTNNDRGDKILE
jgi:hypothetical protein